MSNASASIGSRLGQSRLVWPLAGLGLLLLFETFSMLFENFLLLRVIANLFANNAHGGVIAVGMTFVNLSGGIGLSVGSVLGFTTILVAALIARYDVPPVLAIGLALLVGSAFGAGMGAGIQVYELPPFLVTLAGMFLARGLAFVVSAQSLEIKHGFYAAMIDFGIPLTEKVTVRAPSCIFVAVFLAALGFAHFSRFGRNVYAIGGNASSALLMGLPVGRTRIWIYTLSCPTGSTEPVWL